MKITQQELAGLRGTIYQLEQALLKAAGPTALLLRTVKDQLKLVVSFLEQPFPHDEPMRNALTMLFLSMIDEDDSFIPKDKDLYRSAMRRIRELMKDDH